MDDTGTIDTSLDDLEGQSTTIEVKTEQGEGLPEGGKNYPLTNEKEGNPDVGEKLPHEVQFSRLTDDLSSAKPVDIPDPVAGSFDEPEAAKPDWKPQRASRSHRKLTDEEKEARRLERAAKKKLERSKSDDRVAAQMAAETVLAGLDALRDLVSAGECLPNPDTRAATLAAWERYCFETGRDIPPSAMVIITTTLYVAPAINTKAARGGISGIVRGVKTWWINRNG